MDAASRPAWRSARGCSNLILADLYGPQRLLRDGLLPPRAGLREPGFLRPCHGVPRAGRPLPAPLRRRSRARRRRPLVGARRPHAGAVGRRLRAREPHRRCRACCPRRSATAACSGWRRSSARCATRCARSRPRNRDNPRIVLLTPGPVQRDLLRARLPRALPRLHAGRGRRPDRARRPRLPEDARRAAAGRRDPAPARRRLLRSAGAARATRSLGVAGLVQAVRAGNVAVANALGQRRRSRRRRCSPSCPGSAGSCSARSCSCRRVADVVVRRAARALSYVLEHLDELVIKPAFPRGRPRAGVRRRAVAPRARAARRRDPRPARRVRRRRSSVALSTAPVLGGGRLEPRAMVAARLRSRPPATATR